VKPRFKAGDVVRAAVYGGETKMTVLAVHVDDKWPHPQYFVLLPSGLCSAMGESVLEVVDGPSEAEGPRKVKNQVCIACGSIKGRPHGEYCPQAAVDEQS
jgi:hypothetical protein